MDASAAARETSRGESCRLAAACDTPRISANAPQGCKLLPPAFCQTAAAALSGAMRKRIRLSGVGIQKRMREAACWRRRPGAAILRQRPAFVPLIRASTRSVLAYRAASPPSEEHFGRPSGKTAPCGRLPPHLRNTWCRRRYRSIGPKCERLRCGFIFALPLPAGLNGCGPLGSGAAKPPPLSSRLPNRRISCSCHTFGWLGLLRIALRISSRLSGMPAQDYALARGRYGPSPLVGRLDSSSNRRGLSLTLFIPISFASPISAFPQFLPALDAFFA